jgi:hypothetical protein
VVLGALLGRQLQSVEVSFDFSLRFVPGELTLINTRTSLPAFNKIPKSTSNISWEKFQKGWQKNKWKKNKMRKCKQTQWERGLQVVLAMVCFYEACASTPSAGHPLTSFSFLRPRRGHCWNELVSVLSS